MINILSLFFFQFIWSLIFIIIGGHDILTPFMIITIINAIFNASMHFFKESFLKAKIKQLKYTVYGVSLLLSLCCFGFLIFAFAKMGMDGNEEGTDITNKAFGTWMLFFAILTSC